MNMDELRTVSINAKGLNVPGGTLQKMHRMWADVMFVHETHFRDDKLPVLKNTFFPMTYHSTFPTEKVRGAFILPSARIPWTHLDTWTDPEGRFILLKGVIGTVKVTLANFYVSNSQQDLFISWQLRALREFTEGHLILGGDFNIPLIPTEDTSSETSSILPGTWKQIAKSLHNAQLVDAWRIFHPDERDYTFFSAPHQVYSRINYFLIPHTQLHAIRDTSIGSITWTDHAPVMITYWKKVIILRYPSKT